MKICKECKCEFGFTKLLKPYPGASVAESVMVDVTPEDATLCGQCERRSRERPQRVLS